MTKKVHFYLMRCSFLDVHEVKGKSTRICCFELEHSGFKAILRNGALWVMSSVCARHSAPCLYWNTDTLYIGMWANGASVHAPRIAPRWSADAIEACMSPVVSSVLSDSLDG